TTNVRGHMENAARYVRGGRKLPGSFSDSRICVRAAQVDTKEIHFQEGVFRHCHQGRESCSAAHQSGGRAGGCQLRNSHGARFEALCRYRAHEHAVWSSDGHHGVGGVSPSVYL
ncbi:hypothetical protein LTR40_009560, partial [Exophiala xenobiotica]